MKVGDNVFNFSGDCSALSNALIVEKIILDAGSLDINGNTEIDLCYNTEESQVLNLNQTGFIQGAFSYFILTSSTGEILEITQDNTLALDFLTTETCLVYALETSIALTLTTGDQLSELDDCFDLSNAVIINKERVDGGEITTVQETTEQIICVGEDDASSFPLLLENNISEFSVWLITDTDNNIIANDQQPPFDLSNLNTGNYRIWHLAYNGSITGIEPGSNAAGITGNCFDLSNFVAVELTIVDGGIISTDQGTSFDICVGDGLNDLIDVSLQGNESESSAWLLTDDSGLILEILPPPPFDLDDGNMQEVNLWHLAFSNNILGLTVGNNVSDIQGCFDLSNSISINKRSFEGGDLTSNLGDNVDFCVGDGIADELTFILQGGSGVNNQLIITDTNGNILVILQEASKDFDNSATDTCLVWNLSFDMISGLVASVNIYAVQGCYGLSNPVVISKQSTSPGIINSDQGDDISICSNDATPDIVNFTVQGVSGEAFVWLVTDESGIIIELSNDPEIDFEGSPDGTCLVWHLSYLLGLEGLEPGNSATELEGCYSLSNFIRVSKQSVSAGTISTELGEDIVLCVQDGMSDIVNIETTGSTGSTNQLLITDTLANLIALPVNNSIDFDDFNTGVCLIWNLAYSDFVSGLSIGNNVSQIQGCYALSNAIQVEKISAEGGNITTTVGDSLFICANDGESDLFDIDLEGASAKNSLWLFTDLNGQILELPGPPPYELDRNISETYLIWHLAYSGPLENLAIGNNASELIACLDLSNSIYVSSTTIEAGELDTAFGQDIEICVGDDLPDLISFELEGSNAPFNQLLITDVNGEVLALPSDNVYDFNDSETGICLAWNWHTAPLTKSLSPEIMFRSWQVVLLYQIL